MQWEYLARIFLVKLSCTRSLSCKVPCVKPYLGADKKVFGCIFVLIWAFRWMISTPRWSLTKSCGLFKHEHSVDPWHWCWFILGACQKDYSPPQLVSAKWDAHCGCKWSLVIYVNVHSLGACCSLCSVAFLLPYFCREFFSCRSLRIQTGEVEVMSAWTLMFVST